MSAELAALRWQRDRLLHLLTERWLRERAALPMIGESFRAELLKVADSMQRLRHHLERWEP
mgnify:CR=1 FL=1